MPIEYAILRAYPPAIDRCPQCHEPFSHFLRGQVQRSRRVLGFLWTRPYCAVICQQCKAIVGWEEP
jgi:hypothetical protein